MTGREGHALVLGDGAAPTRAGLDAAWPDWDGDVTLVVAADGGARLATGLDLHIDRWVGDGDSFPRTRVAQLAATGTVTRLVPSAKDESDLELALVEAVESGVARVTILGALGGPRLDHELANLALLAHPALADVDASLLDERTRARLITADAAHPPVTLRLAGRPGDLVSLLPQGSTVTGITTTGLEYPLAGEPLEPGPARGLSNVRLGSEAAVTVRAGRLLVVETLGTVPE
jgi:thiamine pyrophosphokinase